MGIDGQFRPDLDLSQYIDNLGDSTAFGGTVKAAPRPEPIIEEEARERERRNEEWRLNTPQLVPDGPAIASSCTALERSPARIWDVNGYYRALGFSAPFTGITRAALRVAYLDAGGPDDAYLTEVFRLLLDGRRRREYDCAPFGEMYLDEIQQKLLIKRAAALAAQRSAEQRKEVDKGAVLDEWGYLFTPGSNPGLESLDEMRHDPPDSSDEARRDWPWGYYLWGTTTNDKAKLAQWQELLVTEFAKQNVHTRFSVGFCGRRRTDSEWVTAVIGSHQGIFIHEDVEPTDGHAAAAVAFVLNEYTGEK